MKSFFFFFSASIFFFTTFLLDLVVKKKPSLSLSLSFPTMMHRLLLLAVGLLLSVAVARTASVRFRVFQRRGRRGREKREEASDV